MRKKNDKWIITTVVIVANLVLWAVPSDLAYNVAQERDILLGRYTVDRFVMLFLLVLLSVLVLCFVWSKKKNRTKEDLFRFLAVSVSVIVSIVVVDVYLRLTQRRHYIKKDNYYYRVPNEVNAGVAKDVPTKIFSYPRTPPGYPDIEYALTTDKRGFRNKSDLEKYDVVVLGDSFAEGSNVSDGQVWAVLFAEKSGMTVYNLGMSAGSPVTYLEALRRFALGMSPKTVVCMLYEGNDFRAANFSEENIEGHRSLEDIFRTSPLRRAIMGALVRYLGPINISWQKDLESGGSSNKADSFAPSHPLYAVSWLPLAIPDGPQARYYAFKVKRLLAHCVSREDFINSGGWQATFEFLGEIKKVCDENGIRLIIIYAPDKPHTLLPLVSDRLSPDKLRAFMALREENLPPAEELMETVLEHLPIQESVVEEFCRQESIEFVSLTEPLRQKTLEGGQTYFTYDQHWTPVGHEVAAETLRLYMESPGQ